MRGWRKPSGTGVRPASLDLRSGSIPPCHFTARWEGRAIEPGRSLTLSTERPIGVIPSPLYHKNRHSDHFWASKPHSTASFRAITTNVVFLHLSDLLGDLLSRSAVDSASKVARSRASTEFRGNRNAFRNLGASFALGNYSRLNSSRNSKESIER